MRPLAAMLTALLAALAFAGPAAAAPMPAPVPPGAAIAPGSIVVTAVPELPAGAEEFELLLVPDAGPAVRVSPETPAGARVVRWRMPALAARSARLVWRTGGERYERESAPSAAFALAPLPAGEDARVLQGRSEAGTTLGASTCADATPGMSAAGKRTTLGTGAPLPGNGEVTPVAATMRAPGASCPGSGRDHDLHAQSPGTRAGSSRVARVPLRI